MEHNKSAFYRYICSSSNRYFTDDYPTARQHFLEPISRLNQSCEVKTWSLSSKLHCDTLWVGESDAKHVCVVISGTHGIEGYCGSAAQLFLLHSIETGALKLPIDSAILFVHALNPWGMLTFRRCDQDGIDLNRNFVDFSQPLLQNPQYLAFLEQLIAIEESERFNALIDIAKQVGQQAFDEIFSGGQYECDWGPFFGGRQPSWSYHVIESIVNDYHLNEKVLVVIDIHSGLGPFGFGELISDHPPHSKGGEFASKVFGPAVAHTLIGHSFSVAKHGLLDYRWHKLMQDKGCFITLEFGSYGTSALFNLLLQDHLLWRNANTLTDALKEAQAKRMLDHFCPGHPLWQQAVLFKSWQVIGQVLSSFELLHHEH